MADYESLFGLDPETADILRNKFGAGQADTMATGAPAPAPQGGVALPPGIDPSWLAPPPPRPTVEGNAHTAPAPVTPKPAAPVPQGLFNYAGGLKPEEAPQEQAASKPATQTPNYGGSGGGPTVIPGHWAHSSAEESGTMKGTPEDQEALRYNADVAAGHAIRAADAKQAAAEMDISTDLKELRRRQAVDDEFRAQETKVAIERRDFAESQKAKLQSMSDELAKDPTESFWAKKSDGDKVLTFVKVLLGGLGAGMSGGPNLALQAIDNEIQRGIKAKQDTYGRQQNYYHDMLNEFGSRAAAVQAAKVAAYDRVAEMLAPLRADAKTERARADHDQVMSGIYNQKVAATKDFMATQETSYKSTDKYHDQQVVGGQPKALGNLVTLSDGTTYQLQNEKQANDVVEKLQASSALTGLYAEAGRLRKELEDAPAGSVQQARAHDDLARLTRKIINFESVAEGQGQVKEKEMDAEMELSPVMKGVRGRGIIGAAASALTPFRDRDFKTGNEQIQSSMERNKQREERLVKAARGRVVNETMTVDPRTGELTPTASYTGQVARPDAPLPPDGFKAYDDRVRQPTMGRPGAETTKYLPPKKKATK